MQPLPEKTTLASEPRPTAPQRRPVLRVLVVDDSPSDRHLTILQLGQVWPFDKEMAVLAVGSGEEAIAKIRSTRLSLVVLDWNMPRVGGEDVLRTVRELGIRVPLLVLSGQCRDELDIDLESLGAAYLNKNNLTARSLENAIVRSFFHQEHGQSQIGMSA